MSNPWLLAVKNGGCEQGSRVEGEDRPVPIGCKDNTEDISVLTRSTEDPVEVEKLSDRQDGALWNERERTCSRSVDMMNTGNVKVEDEMYDRHIVLPVFVENGTMDEGSLSSEWVMSAGEFGQVLLEVPDNQAGDLHDGCAQIDVKAESGDSKNRALRRSSLLDRDNPGPLTQNVMGVGSESLSNADLTLFDSSSDKSITRNCDQLHLKLDEPNLFHIIEIVQQKHPLGIDISENNILQQSRDSQSSQTIPLNTVKTEVYDSSTSNLQTITLEKLLSVTNTSASNQCFPEECFSVANFENVLDVNASSGTASPLCQIIDAPSVNYNNDVLPLCQMKSDKLNEEAILSAGQCALRSDTELSVMDLVLETSVFIKDGYESEIKRPILTYGAGAALQSTFKEYFNTDCVNFVTQSPGAGLNELDQSGIQKPLPVNVLSVVSLGSLSECADSKMPATGIESVEMKQLKTEHKSQNSSKSSVSGFGRSAIDIASKKKGVLLKGVNQQSTILFDVDRHEGEEVSCDQTESKKFVCSQEDCDWSFPTAYKLRRHEETHEGRKDFMCSVDGCNKKFTTVYNLKTHLRLHNLPCTEVCPQPNCSLTFRNKRLLDKHVKLHSDGEKTYKCPFPGCTKTFFSHMSIGSHARVHQHDSELICAFNGCGRKFDKLCRLKQHMRCHTGERPYRCTVEGCNWAFSTSSRLCRHLQMHNGQKKWSCPFEGCSKLFTRAEHVKGHLVTHSSQRPFMCMNNGCDARFKSKNSLDLHLRRHSQMGDKKKKQPKAVLFYCPHEDCSQKFSTKAQLRGHIDSNGHLLLSTDPHSSSSSHHHPSAAVEHLSMMVGLDLEGGLEGIVHRRTSSSSSSSAAAVSKDLNLLTTPVVPHSSNIVTSEQAADIGFTSHVTTPTSGLNLLSLPVLVASEPSAAINSSSSSSSSSSSASFLSGPTRTDFTSYQLVNNQIRTTTMLKWQDQHCLDSGLEDTGALLNIGHLKDLASLSSEPLHCLPGVMLNADEIMTSHAITFRDPETGTIYVQTQLMQDDPPPSSTNMYLDDDDDDDGSTGLHLESSMDQPPVLAPDLTSMLHNDSNFDDEDSRGDDAFTGTTINLQDLE